MRVLFTVLAERSMFESMVPLAWAMRTAGHDVRVAAHPELSEHVTAAGLTSVPVGRDHFLWKLVKRSKRLRDDIREDQFPPFDQGDTPVSELDLDRLQAGYDNIVPWMFRPVNEAIVDDLVGFCRDWRPELVLWEPRTFAGAIAAEAVGAVQGRMLWGVDYFARLRRHYLGLRADRGADAGPDTLAEWLTGLGARYGVEFSEELTRGRFTVDQFPPSMATTTDIDYLRMRYVPYNGRSVIPPWLWERPERRRVCLTLGLSAMGRDYGYSVSIGDLLRSLSGLDAEIVATVPEPEQPALGELPSNVRVESFVPLQALIPTCSAVVHHGGFGSTNTPLVAGVPQLVIAQQFDSPAKARMLSEMGCGLHVPIAEVTPEKVRDGVRRLLEDPTFAENSMLLRNEVLAQPSPNEIVQKIEALVDRNTTKHGRPDHVNHV
jgi:glycosyltransferase (activator-dependent family)